MKTIKLGHGLNEREFKMAAKEPLLPKHAVPTPDRIRKPEKSSASQESAPLDPGAALHTPGQVIRLQRVAGNRAVGQLIQQKARPGVVQAKLTVGPAKDAFEQEADRVAAAVVNAPAQAEVAQRAPEEEEELQAKPDLQRNSSDGFEAGDEIEHRLEGQKGSGSPLPAETRAFMEPRFGADFSGVQLHTDSAAAQLSRDLNAQAFTRGPDIFMGSGTYNPGTSSGKELLAHELTHVVQQGSAQAKSSQHPILAKPVRANIDLKAVQRLMTVNTASTRIRPQKVNLAGKLFGTQTSTDHGAFNLNREALMNYIREVHVQLNSPIGRTALALKAQLSEISDAYDGLVRSVTLLLEKLHDPDDERYLAALEIRVHATNEKTQVLQVFLAKMANPPGRRGATPTVASLIDTNTRVEMNSARMTGQVGGGMNTLTTYAKPGGGTEYFKPNISSIDHYQSLDEADKTESSAFGRIINALMEASNTLLDTPEKILALGPTVDAHIDYGEFGNRQGFARAFSEHKKRGVNTEFQEHAGIDLDDLRSSNREVAMARLDILLDANLVSRADLAIKKTGLTATPRLGSVATGATGKEISKYNLVNDAAHHPGTSNTIRRDDPVLLSKLNGLQMIDFIAGQVDRHQGNYIIEVDGTGQVLNITGIDNDMSFGTKDTATMGTRGARQLPGLGMYFDTVMANKILALDPDLVRIALSDLLTRDEIQSTLQRLALLKTKLATAQATGNLLTPAQWSGMINLNPANFKRGDYAVTAATGG